MSDPKQKYSSGGQSNRLPEPEPEQTALGMEAVRRALGGQEVRLYQDSSGRLCVVPLDRGEVERA